MTILEAISGEIEPYALSDNSVEKAWMDSCGHFGLTAGASDVYDNAYYQPVALASMYCLSRLIVLVSENIGGISQNYKVSELEARIKSIAARSGLSSGLALSDSGSENRIECISI